jgi:hypothetical protein
MESRGLSGWRTKAIREDPGRTLKSYYSIAHVESEQAWFKDTAQMESRGLSGLRPRPQEKTPGGRQVMLLFPMSPALDFIRC